MNVPKEKPLDERFREAEQHSFNFDESPSPRPPSPDLKDDDDYHGRLFCYCPRCNPR